MINQNNKKGKIMGEVSFYVGNLIEIGLLLLACYCCRLQGYHKGITDTLEYLDKNETVDTLDVLEAEENEKN